MAFDRLIGDEDKLYWPLSRGDGVHCLIGWSMCRYKAHVSGRDICMKVDMFQWPLMAAELHGVSSDTGSIIMAKIGVSEHSDDASSCSPAVRMSSG
jgi:uncharacterized protein YqjF (DUF2071 family)